MAAIFSEEHQIALVRSDMNSWLLRWSAVQSLQRPHDEWHIMCLLFRQWWIFVGCQYANAPVRFKVALLMHVAHASYITDALTLISRRSSRRCADSTDSVVPSRREQSCRQSIVRCWTLCEELIFPVSETTDCTSDWVPYIPSCSFRCNFHLFRFWTIEFLRRDYEMLLATHRTFWIFEAASV